MFEFLPRHRRVTASTILLLALLAMTAGGQSADQFGNPAMSPRLAAIDSIARPLIGTATPGLAIVIVRAGRVIHRAGYGTADLARDLRFTPTTPTYIASIGKMFTAMAVLRLVQDGRLSLDMTLGEALPSAPAYAHRVTLAQMLTHTSGLIDHYDIGGEERAYSLADVHEILSRTDSLLFEPGSNNSYSNSAYVLLAEVVARAAGMSFRDYLQRTFFTPLGMAGTNVVTGLNDRPGQRAIGYRLTAGRFTPYDYESSTVGAGGIYSTADDLARFALALRAGKVLSPALLARATSMAIRTDGRGTPYGMGWLSETGRLGDRRDVHYVAGVGTLRGFWSLFKWYDSDDLQIIWVSNAAENTTFDALMGISTLPPER